MTGTPPLMGQFGATAKNTLAPVRSLIRVTPTPATPLMYGQSAQVPALVYFFKLDKASLQ